MKTFNISVRHLMETVFTVTADGWQEAVEIASTMAADQELDTIGGVAVYDEDMRPLDTTK